MPLFFSCTCKWNRPIDKNVLDQVLEPISKEAGNYIRYKYSFDFPWGGGTLVHTTPNQVCPIFLLQLLSFRKELRQKQNYKGIQNPSTKHAPFSTKLVSSETNSLAVRRLALLDGKLSTARIQNQEQSS